MSSDLGYDEYVSDFDPNNHYFSSVFPETNSNDQSKYYNLSEYYNLFDKNLKSMIFLNHNVRSFNANSNLFCSTFIQNNILPDLICLSETWNTFDSQPDINDYNGFHTYRNLGSSGGVSLYTKSDINPRKVDQLSFSSNSIEICTIDIKVPDLSLAVVAVYRSPNSEYEHFQNLLYRCFLILQLEIKSLS